MKEIPNDLFKALPKEVFLITQHTPFNEIYVHKLVNNVHYFSKPEGGNELYWQKADVSCATEVDLVSRYEKQDPSIKIVGVKIENI